MKTNTKKISEQCERVVCERGKLNVIIKCNVLESDKDELRDWLKHKKYENQPQACKVAQHVKLVIDELTYIIRAYWNW